MIIKKYVSRTEEEAMELAKKELGADAIVMNIKKLKPKGLQRFFHKPSVEITAAIDDNITYSDGEKMLEQLKQIQKREHERSKAAVMDVVGNEPAAGASAIEEKLNSLQVMLEQQMKEQQAKEAQEKEKEREEEKEKEEAKETGTEKNEACYQLIRRQMMNNEVEAEYADVVLGEIRSSLKEETSVDNILANVYQKIILKLGRTHLIELKDGKNGEEKNCKYVFFIGPTGVGKTTTIAKIASSFQLKKKAKTALITSDTYRIAAVEQLKTYGNIMGIPLKVVYSPEEMKESMKEFEDFDLVLIDTAGRSHKDAEQRDDIEQLIRSIPVSDREVYLVLSATTKYKDLVRITRVYQEITDYALIFTKLDETDCIGNIFNIRLLTDAPLSYATWGQNVPEDIGVINPQKIAKQLLGGNE